MTLEEKFLAISFGFLLLIGALTLDQPSMTAEFIPQLILCFSSAILLKFLCRRAIGLEASIATYLALSSVAVFSLMGWVETSILMGLVVTPLIYIDLRLDLPKYLSGYVERVRGVDLEDFIMEVSRLNPPKAVLSFISRMIPENLEKSWVFVDRETFSKFIFNLTVISFAAWLSVFAGVYVAAVDWTPITLLSLPLFLLLPYLLSILWLIERRVSRSGEVKREMPAFSLILAIFGGLNRFERGLKYVSEELPDFFSALSREIKLIERNLMFFFRDLREAVVKTVRDVPNKEFREYMLEYVDALHRGGEASEFTKRQMDRFLRDIEEKWDSLQRNIVMQMDAAFLFFGILPVALAMLLLILNLRTVFPLVVLFMVIYAASAVFLTIYLDEVQPQMRDEIEVGDRVYVGFVAGVVTLTVMRLLRLNLPFNLNISIPLTVGLTPITVAIFKQIREVDETENGLRMFLNDLIDLMRVGYSVEDSVRRLSGKRYGSKLGEILSSFKSGLRSGRGGLYGVKSVKVRSKLAKVALISLAATIEVGGGLIEVERLRDFVDKYLERKKKVFTNSFFSAIVALSIPSIGLLGLKVFEDIVRVIAAVPQGFIPLKTTVSDLEPLISMGKFLVFVSSIAIGTVLGKMISGTVRNTLYLNICLLMYSASLVLTRFINFFNLA